MMNNKIIWKKYQGVLMPQIAPHIEITISTEEAKKLLKLHKPFFIRYISNWDSKEETQFWYIIKDIEENLEQYNSKRRYEIKKGLKNCIVKKVDNKEIAINGYEVYKKALKKYKTELNILNKDLFYRNYIDNPQEFFAVYEKKERKMIAYSSNIIRDNMVTYSAIKFDPDYLKLYPSYALFYTMNQYYINEQKFLYVNDGARSISHDTNIQEFLIQKFNFRKAYCKLNVIYRTDINILVKCLYPFRNIVNKVNNKYFKKISVLLKQERIRRSYEHSN